MKRIGFLKSLATLIAAPSILAKVDKVKGQYVGGTSTYIPVHANTPNMFLQLDDKRLRIGHIICSDLGSKAMVTHQFHDKDRIISTLKPCKKDEYNCIDVFSYTIIGSQLKEA